MRSAYMLLGIPGNATPEDIEAAYRKAQELYPRERLATEDGAMARLNELKEAYRVLKDAESRAAHDRKLAQAVSTEPVSSWVEIHYPESKAPSRWGRTIALFALMLAVFGGGAWYLEGQRDRAAAEAAAAQAAETARKQAEADAQLQRTIAAYLAGKARRDAEARAEERAQERRRQRELAALAKARRDQALQTLQARQSTLPVQDQKIAADVDDQTVLSR